MGFSEDDERVRRTDSTFGAGRVDLPVTGFNQYNVPMALPLSYSGRSDFAHVLTNGCAAK